MTTTANRTEYNALAAEYRALSQRRAELVFAVPALPVPAELDAALTAAADACARHPYSVACAANYRRNGEEE